MSKKETSLRGVVDLPEENQLLKYIPEAVHTLNSYANMCKYDAQEYYFLLHTIRKSKTTYKHKTHYKGKKATVLVINTNGYLAGMLNSQV